MSLVKNINNNFSKNISNLQKIFQTIQGAAASGTAGGGAGVGVPAVPSVPVFRQDWGQDNQAVTGELSSN